MTDHRIDALQRERDELQATKDKVLELPRKIRHPVMVPLSKVAFTAGNLVHTNEFCLGKAGIDDQDSWMSHIDAAAELQARIDAIDAQLGGALLAPTPASAPVPSPAPAPAPAQKSRPKTKPLPPPPAEDEANGPIFEIREFVDEAGGLVQHQVVDLQRELEGLQRSLGEAGPEEGAAEAAEVGIGAGAGTGTAGAAGAAGSAGTEGQKRAEARRVVADLESKLQGLREAAGSDGGRPDGDAAFVRELHELARRREARLAAGMEDDDDEGGDWQEEEGEEDEEEEDEDVDFGFLEQLAQEEDRAREERERARGEITQAGWGRGFLGGSGGGAKAGAKAAPGLPKKEDKKNAASLPPAPPPAPAPAARPVAFAANIIERGFP